MMVQLADVAFNVPNVHEPGLLKPPPALASPQLTGPPGVVGDVEVSVTVAVYVIVFPMVTLDGFGDTLVVVESCE